VDVLIRGAEPADIPAVLALMQQLAEHEGLAQYFQVTSEAFMRCCFEPPQRLQLIVAELADEIVGYATCLLQFSPWIGNDYLFLDDLYVSADVRGKGVGSRLMQQVGKLALERGVDVRWHVDPENRAAQKFYGSMGAVLKAKLIAYWQPDAIREGLLRP
jgi:ribosomal protein S18 acetylase RimI-like enzyme